MRVGRSLTGLGVGILFGLGLSVSQMVNPEKVLAFLDVASNWDASLLFVMGAASLTAFVGYRWVVVSPPVFDVDHHIPTNRQIDWRLMVGASIFGIGWGIAGYCPGPAITGLSSGKVDPLAFVVAMLVGSQIARLFETKRE